MGRIYMSDREMLHTLGQRVKFNRDYIRLLRRVPNLKVLNCSFLEFSTFYCHTSVDSGQLRP